VISDRKLQVLDAGMSLGHYFSRRHLVCEGLLSLWDGDGGADDFGLNYFQLANLIKVMF
jgi:hypothetical protein